MNQLSSQGRFQCALWLARDQQTMRFVSDQPYSGPSPLAMPIRTAGSPTACRRSHLSELDAPRAHHAHRPARARHLHKLLAPRPSPGATREIRRTSASPPKRDTSRRRSQPVFSKHAGLARQQMDSAAEDLPQCRCGMSRSRAGDRGASPPSSTDPIQKTGRNTTGLNMAGYRQTTPCCGAPHVFSSDGDVTVQRLQI